MSLRSLTTRLWHALGIRARTGCAVLASWSTVAALTLALKSIRVAAYPFAVRIGVWDGVSLLGSELLFALASGALMLLCACVFDSTRRPRLMLAPLGAFAACVIVVDCVAHGYFIATGGTLDYALVKWAWARPRDTGPIVLSELRPSLGALLGLMPLLAIVPAFFIMKPSQPAPPRRPAVIAALSLIACAGVASAMNVTSAAAPASFAREPALTLARGLFGTPKPTHTEDLAHVQPRPSGATALRRMRDVPPYNVVFIVLESARADATTPYSPKRDNTPALAQLARESTLVERAYTVVPHTSKSLVAMLCGFEPRTSAELVETQPRGLPGRCLPRLLRDVGYDTRFFQASRKRFESYSQLVANLGFAHFIGGEDLPEENFDKVNYFGDEDAILLEPNRAFLSGVREPFLAVYLTNTSHHPYGLPERWQKRHYARAAEKNDYLNALAYVDSVMGQLLEQYKAAGMYDRTLFVVLGDHGEGFGEHGMWTHDNILYEEGVRVPLLFRIPGAAPARVSGPVNQLAIVPTVLDVLGLAPTTGSYAASSVRERPRQDPLQLACFRNAHCLAELRDSYKLLYFYGDRPTQLFELSRDPGERHNLAGEQPQRTASAVHELLAWEASVDALHQTSSQRALARYVQREPFEHIQHERSVRFGDWVELVGFKAEIPRPDGAHITCYLHVLSPLPEGVHFALSIRSGFWHSRTLDEQPVRGLYPYRRWQAGDYIANVYRSDWPASWKVMESCLTLLDAGGHAVRARSDRGDEPDCVPLTTLDHESLREK
jgi:arylsulfatase A-like enzyme